MTQQEFESLLAEGTAIPEAPKFPWRRVKSPLLATLDVDGFYIPDNPANPFPGIGDGYGKGYTNLLRDSAATRIPLTPEFMKYYFNDESMRSMEKMIRGMKWASPYGNCLYDRWGGTFQNFSSWRVQGEQDNSLHLQGVPLTEPFYQRLGAHLSEGQIRQMKETQVEVISFDKQGTSIWFRKSQMVCNRVDDNANHFGVFGSNDIVGGTGIFKGATGSVKFTGFTDHREPQSDDEPNFLTRLGIWGTIEYWWPVIIPNLYREAIPEATTPWDIYQEINIQEVAAPQVEREEPVTQ